MRIGKQKAESRGQRAEDGANSGASRAEDEGESGRSGREREQMQRHRPPFTWHLVVRSFDHGADLARAEEPRVMRSARSAAEQVVGEADLLLVPRGERNQQVVVDIQAERRVRQVVSVCFGCRAMARLRVWLT